MTWLAYIHCADGETVRGALGDDADAAANRLAHALPAPLLIGRIWVREVAAAEDAQMFEVGVYRVPA